MRIIPTWAGLIERVWAGRFEPQKAAEEEIGATQQFIRETVEKSKAFEARKKRQTRDIVI